MKKPLIYALLLALLMTGMGFAIGKDWGYGAAFASAVYGILVSVFLAAQVYGFVVSQVKYSESIEDAKFKVLEVEGITFKAGAVDAKENV